MREPAHSEAIILARNKLGDLVREENHSGVYQHEYDALSNLSATTFPDGRELKFLRYGTGHLLEMQLSLSGKTLPVTGYQRDRLHRETHRTMGALELETHYDMAGRITHRRCADNLRDRLVSERRYQWDRADQIIRRMYTDGAPSTPAGKYRQSLWGYDAAGRMTQSLQPEGEERFWYDAADNRTTPELQPVWNNLLKRLDGVSREYDGFGRMTVRHDTHRRVTQRFSYDDEHRISQVTIEGDAEYTRAEYRYDALGRRTEKQVWRRHARKPERTQYAWSGLQMVGETSDSHPDAAVQYIYSENSYEPLARVDSHGEHAEIFWYHTELNGLPDSVTDSSGDTVWRGASTAWGRSLRESTPVTWDTPQNLRFQGQYLDRETGLHYNTFRYYDPAGGCYTQMDPIGLLGGLNTYTYVVDPLVWVDPLGLSSFDPFIHGEITDFPKDLHFGQNRIAPKFSNIGSQAADSIAGRPILDVAADIKSGKISPDTFVISYTRDPATGKAVTLNNRGLAALVEAGKLPQNAIYVPYEHVPKHLVEDIRYRAPSRSINITRNKDGTGLVKAIGKCL